MGLLIAAYAIWSMEEGMSVVEYYFRFVVILAGIVIGMLLQLPLHEAGHLLFGLASGYTFNSFRIGSFMWIQENEKIRFRKKSLAGTGGQCLMNPPEPVNGKIPYILYNLGGSLMNVIISFIFLVLFIISGGRSMVSFFLFGIVIIGLPLAFMNGVPMKTALLVNDGYNMVSIGKSEEAMRAFWIQLNANKEMSKGVRVKDMPQEWFSMPSDEGMKNVMVAAVGFFACNRLMDEHRFKEAHAGQEHLLELESAMVGVHRNMLICDSIFCELLAEKREDKLAKMNDKELTAFRKSMQTNPSILRTEYAYALLYEKDEKKAKQIMEQFEKCALTYPYQCDIESERELIEIVQKACE